MTFMKDIFAVMFLDVMAQRGDIDLCSNHSISFILLMILSLNSELQRTKDALCCIEEKCCNGRRHDRHDDERRNDCPCPGEHRQHHRRCRCIAEATPFAGLFPGQFR